MIRYFFTNQFLRFLAVGGLAAIVNWLSRIQFSNWLSFPWAIASAYAVGMSLAFALNSFFVYLKSEKPRHKQARDFVIVNLSFLPLVWIASITIDHALQSHGIVRHSQALAHGIAVGLPMLVNFLIYKFFAFKDTPYGQS
ncbi:MAG: GtrA family protein [Methylococcales bacterium]